MSYIQHTIYRYRVIHFYINIQYTYTLAYIKKKSTSVYKLRNNRNTCSWCEPMKHYMKKTKRPTFMRLFAWFDYTHKLRWDQFSFFFYDATNHKRIMYYNGRAQYSSQCIFYTHTHTYAHKSTYTISYNSTLYTLHIVIDLLLGRFC